MTSVEKDGDGFTAARLSAELLKWAGDMRPHPVAVVLERAGVLIEQQAATSVDMEELVKFWIADSKAAHEARSTTEAALTTAEAERDELLREKERLEREVERLKSPWRHATPIREEDILEVAMERFFDAPGGNQEGVKAVLEWVKPVFFDMALEGSR